MAESKNTYLKAGIWYTVGNILIKGVSFIALPIFTRLLSPDDFGKYNIFMSYESILAVVLGMGFSGTIKIAYFDFKGRFKDYFSSILSLTVIATLLFDILSVIGYLFFKFFLGEIWTPGLIQLLIFASLGTAIYNLISVKYVIYAEYKENLAISFIYTISNVLLSIILCYTLFSVERYLARIVGYTLPIMLISYVIALLNIVRSKVVYNKEYWLYALKLGSPLIIHSLAMTLLVQIGKIMINSLCGDAETGIYSVGATIAGILTVVLGSFDNAWAPWFYHGLDEGKYAQIVKGNNRITLVFAIICSCFMLVSPEMIMMMTTTEYYEAIYSLVPLVVAVFINFMYLFAVNQEYFYKKTTTIAIGTVVATFCGVALNYYLIPIYGYITAAYINCVSNLILFTIHNIIVYRWRKPKVVNLYFLFTLLFLTSAVGGFSIFLREYIFIRYIVVVVLCTPLFRYCRLYLIKKIKK